MMNKDKNWEANREQQIKEQSAEDKAAAERQQKLENIPHLVNLNEDPMLSNVVFLFFEKAVTTIGKGKQGVDTDISLNGLSISKDHAVVKLADNGTVTIKPGTTIAKTKVWPVCLLSAVHFMCNHPILPVADVLSALFVSEMLA
jgi:kinesin family protein 1